MKITYYRKRNFNRYDFYFIDQKVRQAIEILTKRKTLTTKIKQGLELLGYTLVEVPAPQE